MEDFEKRLHEERQRTDSQMQQLRKFSLAEKKNVCFSKDYKSFKNEIATVGRLVVRGIDDLSMQFEHHAQVFFAYPLY